MRQSGEERIERWRESFERAFEHVPLSLYDEDRKPAERAFGEMLDALTVCDGSRFCVARRHIHGCFRDWVRSCRP